MKLSVYSYTNQGGRAHNEDSLRWNCDGARGVFVLADGLGGHACGQVASRLAVDALCPEALDPLPCKEELLERFQAANTRILEQQAQPGQEDMRTTAVALSLGESGAAWAHIGDSRAYLRHGDTVSQITMDHSYVQEQVARGLISKEQAEKSRIQNILTKALGLKKDMRCDVIKLNPQPGDVYMLCSDGVNKGIKDSEIEEILKKPLSAGRLCQEVVKFSARNDGKDNVSCVVFKMLPKKEKSIFKKLATFLKNN